MNSWIIRTVIKNAPILGSYSNNEIINIDSHKWVYTESSKLQGKPIRKYKCLVCKCDIIIWTWKKKKGTVIIDNVIYSIYKKLWKQHCDEWVMEKAIG